MSAKYFTDMMTACSVLEASSRFADGDGISRQYDAPPTRPRSHARSLKHRTAFPLGVACWRHLVPLDF